MSSAVSHVPAWRKLGLKLKYARDTSEASTLPNGSNRNEESTSTNNANGTKRRRSSSPEPHSAQISGKHRRRASTDNYINGRSSLNAGFDNHASMRAGISKASPPTERQDTSSLSATARKRQKSVTFAPDTKEDDGTSARELFDQWRQEESVDDNIAKQPALQAIEHTSSTEHTARKKAKKAKRSKSTSLENQQHHKDSREPNDSSNTSNSIKPSIIQYLETFHGSKDSWKFNKARQNQLFKHILNIEKIPASYDDALLTYLEGLQSPAARDQLRKRASEVREQDIKDGLDDVPASATDTATDSESAMSESDLNRQQDAYRRAVKRLKASAKLDKIHLEEQDHQMTKEWEKRLAARLRSEKMLKTLDEPMHGQIETPQRVKKGFDYDVERVLERDGAGEKRKRKRKRRTTMPIDDSSSTETDSSEDDDDDDHDNSEVEKMSKIKAFVDETSSEGEEFEDSDEEDSEEEDSEEEDSEDSSSDGTDDSSDSDK